MRKGRLRQRFQVFVFALVAISSSFVVAASEEQAIQEFRTSFINFDCEKVPTREQIETFVAGTCPRAASTEYSADLKSSEEAEIRARRQVVLEACTRAVQIPLERKGFLCRNYPERVRLQNAADALLGRSEAERAVVELRLAAHLIREANAQERVALLLIRQVPRELLVSRNSPTDPSNLTTNPALREEFRVLEKEQSAASRIFYNLFGEMQASAAALRGMAMARLSFAQQYCTKNQANQNRATEELCQTLLAHADSLLRSHLGSALYPRESTILHHDVTRVTKANINQADYWLRYRDIAAAAYCSPSPPPVNKEILSLIGFILHLSAENQDNALELAHQRALRALAFVSTVNRSSGTAFRLQLRDGTETWISADHVTTANGEGSAFSVFPEFRSGWSAFPGTNKNGVIRMSAFENYGDFREGRVYADFYAATSTNPATSSENFLPFRLRNLVERPIRVGETIYISGYPAETATSNDPNPTTRACRAQGFIRENMGLIALECDASVNFLHGTSGGPAFDEQGLAIGTVVQSTTAYIHQPGDNQQVIRVTPLFEDCAYENAREPLGSGGGCFVSPSPPEPPSILFGQRPIVTVPCNAARVDFANRIYHLERECTYYTDADGVRRFGFLPMGIGAP